MLELRRTRIRRRLACRVTCYCLAFCWVACVMRYCSAHRIRIKYMDIIPDYTRYEAGEGHA